MKIVILAAGYATRLYPLTKDTPKALLGVGGKPLLNYLVAKINGLRGVSEVVLVTNARFADQFASWVPRSGCSKKIHVLNDGTSSNETRLGAIGDLKFALDRFPLREDVLVLASDNLFEEGLEGFVDFARAKEGATIGVYDLRNPKDAAGRFGVIEIGKESQVLSIEEKPQRPRSSWVSTGLYYFPAFSISWIEEYLQSPERQDAPGFYARWLLGRLRIYAYPFRGRWYDIGNIDQLKQADRDFTGQKEGIL